MKADRIVFGLLVVVVGGIWLLVNLGLLPAASIREIWRYWPVLLIIWGLLLLLGKGNSGVPGCLVALLVFALVFGGAFAFIPTFRVTGHTVQTGISHIPGTAAVQLHLTQHAGEFRMNSHRDGEQIMKLGLQTTKEPVVNHIQNGETAEITVTDTDNHVVIGKQASRWELSLLEGIPTDIVLRTGALDADIDMSRLLVKSLDIKAGAGDLTMKLSRTDGKINIQTGASSITIFIPHDVGVRLHASGALLSVNSDNGRVVSIGDRRYESKDMNSKAAIINIEVAAAAGSVTLKNY